MYLPTILQMYGFNSQEGAMAVTIIGASSGIGRLVCATANLFPHHVSKINVLSSAVAGSAVLVMAYSRDLLVIYAACGVYGTAISPFASLTTTTMIRVVRPKDLSPAIGLEVTIFGLAICIGPSVIGIMADFFGSYWVPFICTASSFFASGLFYGLAGCNELSAYEDNKSECTSVSSTEER